MQRRPLTRELYDPADHTQWPRCEEFVTRTLTQVRRLIYDAEWRRQEPGHVSSPGWRSPRYEHRWIPPPPEPQQPPPEQPEGEESFDPGEHTIAEVKEYVEANPDVAQDVSTLEDDGKDRVTLVTWLEEFEA